MFAETLYKYLWYEFESTGGENIRLTGFLKVTLGLDNKHLPNRMNLIQKSLILTVIDEPFAIAHPWVLFSICRQWKSPLHCQQLRFLF